MRSGEAPQVPSTEVSGTRPSAPFARNWSAWAEGVGLDRVADEGEPGVARQFQCFPGQFECAGDGVLHLLGGGAVEPDVVAGPPGAEVFAAGGTAVISDTFFPDWDNTGASAFSVEGDTDFTITSRVL